MNCGIYEIRNTVNGRRYVGSSKGLTKRFEDHKGMLRRGKHHNLPLQRAWAKYGAESFVFNILAFLELSDVVATEQRLLDLEFSSEPAPYNICKFAIANAEGSKWNDCSKAKARLRPAWNKGIPHSEETKLKISKARLGSKWSEEAKAAMSKNRTGVTTSLKGRKTGRAPHNAGVYKTICHLGHAMTPDNIYLRPDGKGRACLTCHRTYKRRAKLAEAL